MLSNLACQETELIPYNRCLGLGNKDGQPRETEQRQTGKRDCAEAELVSRCFCRAYSKKMPQCFLLSPPILAEPLAPSAHRYGQAQVRLYTDI